MVSQGRGGVAVIGLGAMGGAIARRLMAGGYSVYGCDTNPARRQALSAAGGTPVQRPAELPERCSTFLLVLPDPAATEAAVFGDGGLAESCGTMHGGDVVANLGTIGPDAVIDLAGRLAEGGVEMLDAPMGKTSRAAEEGTLSLMISGKEETVRSRQAVFEQIASEITYCGDLGVASTIKIVNNLISAGILEVVAEGLSLGAKAGASLDLMVKVLSSTGADCWHVRNTFGQRVAERDFAPGFSVDLATKDMKIGVDMAHARQTPLPVIDQAYQRFLEAQAAGLGSDDWSSLVKLSEHSAGVEMTSGATTPLARRQE